VRGLGSIISGDPAVIHHAVGATGKHNKVEIGHWWLIPLTDREHKMLHAGNLVVNRKEFEKGAFLDVVADDRMDQFEVPNEVFEAIQDYHR